MDVISRQAVIDTLSLDKEMLSRVLDDMDVVGTDREKYSWGLGLIESNIKDIEELPSAERRGSWVGIDDEPCDVWECDRCGHIVERECPPRFCEECGAKMDGEQNG